MNTHVDFEIAKLLKEKGFDMPVRYNYDLTGELHNVGLQNHNEHSLKISAPTIAEVVVWLYDKHNIWIVVSYEVDIETNKTEWFWISIRDGEEIAYQYKAFKSPTEAYEAGIEYTLNNLI